MHNDQTPVILIVEDDPLMRMHGVDILEHAGFTVFEAESADAALSILRRNEEVDLLFTDVDMPGSMDGIELASLVRTAWPGIKALLTSSHRNADQFRLTILKDFVAKPWNETALVDRIRLALAA